MKFAIYRKSELDRTKRVLIFNTSHTAVKHAQGGDRILKVIDNLPTMHHSQIMEYIMCMVRRDEGVKI